MGTYGYTAWQRNNACLASGGVLLCECSDVKGWWRKVAVRDYCGVEERYVTVARWGF